MANRLWFFASGRFWGTTTHVANLYADANTTDFLYTPDLSRPIEPVENDKGGGVRLTFQASSKDKIGFSFDRQRNFQDQLTGQLETGTIKNEANQGYCQTHQVTQGTWSRPQSTNLLFDAGVTVSKFNFQGLRRRPVPERLPGVRRSARRQRVDQRHRTGVHLQRRRCRQGPELFAPVERTLQRLVRHQPAHDQDRRVLDVRPGRRTARLQRPRAGAGQRAAGDLHVPQRQTDQPHPVRVAEPAGRSAQPRPRAVRAGSVPAEPLHDHRRPAVRLAPRIRRCVVGARGRAGAGAVVPRHHERAELERSQPETRHRVGSGRRREDGNQVRHQPIRRSRPRRASQTCSIRSARATRWPARREPGTIRTGTSCRTAI